MSLRDYLIYVKETPIRHICWMCFDTGEVKKGKKCNNILCLKLLEDELAEENAAKNS